MLFKLFLGISLLHFCSSAFAQSEYSASLPDFQCIGYTEINSFNSVALFKSLDNSLDKGLFIWSNEDSMTVTIEGIDNVESLVYEKVLNGQQYLVFTGKNQYQNHFNLARMTDEGGLESLIWWNAISGDTIQQYVNSLEEVSKGKFVLSGGSEIASDGIITLSSRDIWLQEIDLNSGETATTYFVDTNSSYLALSLEKSNDHFYCLFSGYDSTYIPKCGILTMDTNFVVQNTTIIDSLVPFPGALGTGVNVDYKGSLLAKDSTLFVNLNAVHYFVSQGIDKKYSDHLLAYRLPSLDLVRVNTTNDNDGNAFGAIKSLAYDNNCVLHGHVNKASDQHDLMLFSHSEPNEVVLTLFDLSSNQLWQQSYSPFEPGHYRIISIDSISEGFAVSGTFYSLTTSKVMPFFMLIDKNGHLLNAANSLELSSVKIFPNPTSELVRFSKPLTGTVDVLDINGKQITKHNLLKETSLQLNHLSRGVYLLRYLGDESFVKRIVVE